MTAQLIQTEWNYGMWAMFDQYDREVAKESYKKGYRFCELNKDSSDVCYLKAKPSTFFRNTKVMRLQPTGELVPLR